MAAPVAVLTLALLAACTHQSAQPGRAEAAPRAGHETAHGAGSPPRLGACRDLTATDVQQPSNTTPTVDCSRHHTAETFAVGSFPTTVADGRGPDDPRLGAYVYDTCNDRFRTFLGGDRSGVMRSTLTWAWFRPSPQEWRRGVHWYRCDVVGGGEQTARLQTLPRKARGLLLGRPDDRWMACVDGKSVADSVKIPCSQPHTWRAVTTIKLGGAKDTYPGDHVVRSRTRSYCSDSVGAWLNYPVDYDFGFTWFHRAEWQAGNRRSICWARTRQ